MSEPRLKTEIWVKSQLRLCDQAFLPCVVVRRGDSDSGQVLIKRNRIMAGCDLLARRFSGLGKNVWTVVAGGDDREAEQRCDAYIARESNIDPDLWVIEIEDPKGQFLPDGQDLVRF